MQVFIASDHAGFGLKEFVKEILSKLGLEVCDLGAYSQDRVDYPDFAQKLCESVLATPESRGVLICGSGIGMSIAANRFSGIRAALCTDSYLAKMARLHNDANVLCMGERVIGQGEAEEIVMQFFGVEFEGGRHLDRVRKLG
ncbi:ribose 5-phosphate isomerase B [uncultured Helicobacter sp.]|uniref:ribose 5-phosphate isomerase B n=1 Tax=uncultured Helicobacter sp. TaxID=175537 RepID=UPI001C3B3CF0|nr:ribose 5-phosphate isomerase B [Candidatus Helicobacter avicola]